MRATGAFLLAMCAACYAPAPAPGAPCADGVCPSGLVCAPATRTCERPGFPGIDAGDVADAPADVAAIAADARPDAQACFGGGLLTICPAMLPTAPLAITSNTNVDTDTSNLCVAYSGADANAYCVIAATTVSIVSNRRLRANGARPLIVLATESIIVDGAIDVSAGAGANPSTCVAPTAATGAQGGAGGSNQGVGGRGANAVSNLGPTPAPAITTLALRGGCAGGNGGNGGSGGSGGGALYLVAPAITINGTLNASGGGGNAGSNVGGGGGGGAGGFIGLDAPSVTVAATGRVFANGGGGGEGGTLHHGGNGGSTPGSPSAASGGSGGANHGGNGGNGSAGTTLTGSNGSNGGTCNRNGAAGGGGGGGAGFTYVFPVQPLDGTVSPPPSLPTP